MHNSMYKKLSALYALIGISGLIYIMHVKNYFSEFLANFFEKLSSGGEIYHTGTLQYGLTQSITLVILFGLSTILLCLLVSFRLYLDFKNKKLFSYSSSEKFVFYTLILFILLIFFSETVLKGGLLEPARLMAIAQMFAIIYISPLINLNFSKKHFIPLTIILLLFSLSFYATYYDFSKYTYLEQEYTVTTYDIKHSNILTPFKLSPMLRYYIDDDNDTFVKTSTSHIGKHTNCNDIEAYNGASVIYAKEYYNCSNLDGLDKVYDNNFIYVLFPKIE